MSSTPSSCVVARHRFLTVLNRRLIGRRFEDPTVKKDMESWPFKVIDDGGNPKVEVDYLGETKSFSPQEISSMILLKVRKSAAVEFVVPRR
jgi:heat shock 70kDa protein 1/2/6/8